MPEKNPGNCDRSRESLAKIWKQDKMIQSKKMWSAFFFCESELTKIRKKTSSVVYCDVYHYLQPKYTKTKTIKMQKLSQHIHRKNVKHGPSKKYFKSAWRNHNREEMPTTYSDGKIDKLTLCQKKMRNQIPRRLWWVISKKIVTKSKNLWNRTVFYVKLTTLMRRPLRLKHR